jgi:hypothetical protein
MPTRTQSLQDFTELAKHALAGHGVVPEEARLLSAAKLLQRLADPMAGPAVNDVTCSHAEMLRRCASDDAA